MPVTIKDIAREAGVSYSTVSRALNNLSLVNSETRERIVDTAKRLGYMPNTSAVSLKRKKSNVIGVYFSTISAMTAPVILHDVVTAVNEVVKEKYLVVVKGVDFHRPGSLNPAIFDGIINITQRKSDEAFIREAQSKNIPIVIVNRKASFPVDTVMTDEEDAFFRSMSYLLERGHRRIAVLEGPKGLDSTVERHRGWVRAVERFKLKKEAILQLEGNYRYQSGVARAEEILAFKPTALLSFNDEMAFGVERVMLQKGLRIPENLSIIGFDNWNQPMYTSMDLTTIERSMHLLSREACKLLLSRIEGLETEENSKTIYMEAPLIERGSVLDLRQSEDA